MSSTQWAGWYMQQAGGDATASTVVQREMQRLGLRPSGSASAAASGSTAAPVARRAPSRNPPTNDEPLQELRPSEIDRLPTVRWDESNRSKECAVCMNAFKANVLLVVLPCSELHIFHRECLATWTSRRNTCPLCRSAVNIKAIDLSHALEKGRRLLAEEDAAARGEREAGSEMGSDR
eukprot:4435189-Prymnesium_polylepis.1